MAIIAPPRYTFIDNPGTALPHNIQVQLVKDRLALNDNPQVMALVLRRLDEERRRPFVRMPCYILQSEICTRLPGRTFALYMWLLGFANYLDEPTKLGEKVYYDLDQWMRAGFIVTARRRTKMAEATGIKERTIARYLDTLQDIGFIKIVNKYKTGWIENTNVYILGYMVKGITVWLSELSTCHE